MCDVGQLALGGICERVLAARVKSRSGRICDARGGGDGIGYAKRESGCRATAVLFDLYLLNREDTAEAWPDSVAAVPSAAGRAEPVPPHSAQRDARALLPLVSARASAQPRPPNGPTLAVAPTLHLTRVALRSSGARSPGQRWSRFPLSVARMAGWGGAAAVPDPTVRTQDKSALGDLPRRLPHPGPSICPDLR